MSIYGDHYAYDFYTWAHDIQCAEKVANELVERVIKKARKKNRKALILYAIKNNDFANYPDSDSNDSIDTLELNEIHSYEVAVDNKIKKTRWFSCFKLNFFNKKKCSYNL
jgi:hypothetical protein